MKYTKWKDTVELIGIAAIVASLIFVGLELRQQQQSALNEAGFHLVENARQIRISRIENADIWIRGNAGGELNSVEAVVYEELILMQWAGAFWDDETFRVMGYYENVATHDFAGFLHQNPGAREVWEAAMAVQREYREQLIGAPIGFELEEIVLADLEKLDD